MSVLSARPSLGNIAAAGALAASAALMGLIAGISPTLALGAAGGVAFLAVLVGSLAMGLCAFVVLTFLEVLASPGGGLIKLAGGVVALAWFVELLSREQLHQGFAFIKGNAAFFTFFVAFLAWVTLSLTWAANGGDATVALTRFVLDALLVVITLTAVVKRRHVVWLYWAFGLGCVLSLGLGLTLSAAALTDTSRLQGAGVDPNDFAIVLVGGMFLTGALAITAKPGAGRWAAAGVAGLCGIGVLLTFSRTGLITLAIALLGGLVVASRSRGRTALLTLLVGFVAVGYFVLLAPPAARERITTVGSGSGRVDLWTVAWRMVDDKPVEGVGAGNFPSQSFHYALQPGEVNTTYLVSPTGLLQVVHNAYLEILAELGIVGLCLFLPIVFLAIGAAVRAARNFAEQGDERMETLTRALIAAQVGSLGGAFFTSLEYSKQLWLLLALGPALLSLSQASPDTEQQR
jgi:O-antigen ligase